MIALKQHFNLRSLKTKGLTLLIEHGPCCILSAAAGFIGVHGLAHNPMLELGFAVGGAFAGEYIGHRLFHRGKDHGGGRWRGARRYALALTFGLASWGVHQKVFHQHDRDHDTCHGHDHPHVHAAAASAPTSLKGGR